MSIEAPCPRCATPTLLQAEHDGRIMLACTRCAGLWLDRGDADGLLAPLTDLHVHTAAYAPLPCPRCRVAMPAQYSAAANVEVDRCQTHGAWFDRDEVAHIANAITRMRGQAPPSLPAPYTQSGWGAAAAGVAVGTAAVALAAATGAGTPEQTHHSAVDSTFHAAEAVAYVPEVAELAVDSAATVGEGAVEVASSAAELLSSVGDVGEVASGALEVGGAVLEGAGEILGAVLGGIGELLSGL